MCDVMWSYKPQMLQSAVSVEVELQKIRRPIFLPCGSDVVTLLNTVFNFWLFCYQEKADKLEFQRAKTGGTNYCLVRGATNLAKIEL